MRIHYIAVFSGCSFLFSVIHPAAVNIFIDSKTSKTASIMNLIQKTLVLAKNTCFRIIHKQIEMTHFVCNIANTLKALVFAVVTGVISPLPIPVTLMIQNLILSNRFPANLSLLTSSFPNSTLSAVGVEFSFTFNIIQTFMASLPEEIAKQNPPMLLLDPASELPHSDTIYALTNLLNILQALTSSKSTNNRDSDWMAKCIVRSGYLIFKSACSPGKEMGIIYKGLVMKDEFLFIGAREKQHSPIRIRIKQTIPRISGFVSLTVANTASGLLDTTEDFEKPQLPREPAFNMRTSETISCIVISNNIHIYTENCFQVCVFQHICDTFPEIWQDVESIDLSPEKMMKIPFINSYQNYKLSSCSYPFSHCNKTVFNKHHDILHT